MDPEPGFHPRIKAFRGRLDDVWTPAFAGVTIFVSSERGFQVIKKVLKLEATWLELTESIN
jgi:hypothetical protein